MGGAALYVETVQDPLLSRPEMRITGQLGDVMKESTSISYTYLNERWKGRGKEAFELLAFIDFTPICKESP